MFGFIKKLFGITEVPVEKKDNMDALIKESRQKYLDILHKDVTGKPRKVTATSNYRSTSSYNSRRSSNDDNPILDTVVNTMIINELLSGNDQVSIDSSFINEDSHGFDGGFGGGDYSGGGSSGSWDDSSSSSDYSSSSDSSYDSSSSYDSGSSSSDW